MDEKSSTVIDVKVSAENIEDKSYGCNEVGCLETFICEKSLKKHLCGHLNVDPAASVIYRFSCPIKTCRRSLKMESEYFNSRKHLYQHYHKVHNSGKVACTNKGCDKKFSTELLRNLHLKNCGKTFYCHCNSSFNSNEALLTHQKRKHPMIVRKQKKKVDKAVMSNNNDYSKKKLDNPPTTREVATTTSGLGLWNSSENLTFPTMTTSVFTSTDQPISSTSFESKATSPAPKLIRNSSTSTAEDFTKEENSNSLSSSSSQNKRTLNWNNLTSGDFDDSLNLFDSDVKMEFYSAETQTDFSDNLFNNNYTQTNFTDFYDELEKFDIQTQTNWDE